MAQKIAARCVVLQSRGFLEVDRVKQRVVGVVAAARSTRWETRKREIQFGDGRKGFERELGEIAEIHLEQARPCTFDLRYNHEMQLQ